MAKTLDSKSKAQTRNNAILTVIAVAGILVLLNFFISPRLFGRVDLTASKVHTLSEASKTAVAGLDDLTVRVFISDPLPETIDVGMGQALPLQGVAQSFRDKLEEYRAYSNGQMDLVYVTDKVEEEAEKAKLQLFASKEATYQKGRLEFQRYAMGATFHYKNVKEVLPLALNPDTYEFEITKILLRLKDKYEQSLMMKDLLSDGKELYDAVTACNSAIQQAVPEEDAGAEEDGLKGLMAAAEQAGTDLEKLRLAKPEITKACDPVKGKLEQAAPKLGEHRNEYLDILVAGIGEFDKAYTVLLERMDATEQAEAMSALEVQQALGQIYDEIDSDHENLVNSPGQRRIGFVCGHGEFCPFPEYEPLVRQDMAAMLGQQNPMSQQVISQAQQIEQQINQVNQGINQNLFKRRGFDIVKVDLTEGVPDNVESLVLLGPTRPLSDRELWALDQFALSGKPVVYFANNWDVSVMNVKPGEELGDEESNEHTAIQENPVDLGKLFAHYGVQVNKDLVAEPTSHELILLTYIMAQGRLRWQTQRAFPYPLLPTFSDLNQDNVLLRNVSSLSFPYTSTVELTGGEKSEGDTTAEVLVRTSREARVVPDSAVGRLPLLPPETLRFTQESVPNGPKSVMAMYQGPVTSFFSGKDIPPRPTQEGEETDQAAADKDAKSRKDTGSARILVIGSNLGLEGLNVRDVLQGFDMAQVAQGGVEFFAELQNYAARFRNWQARITQISELVQDNIRFLFNVLDWSIQNEALVEIRSKGYQSRPLEQLTEGKQSAIKYANILGVPLLFILFGAVRYAISRKRRAKLKAL
jgi:ABC-type uncharacterized transport system involved in gliding motility auxiliary subunit